MTLEPVLMDGLLYVLAGALVGFLSGIMGIGGGIIVVPALLMIFSHNPAIPESLSMHLAAGTSLAVMMFTSSASIRAHYKYSTILWTVYHRLAPGLAIGALVGGLVCAFIPTQWLRYLLVVFLLMIAIKIFLDRGAVHADRFPGIWVNRLISFFIGSMSGLLGLGGGVLIIPYLSFCGVEIRKIAAVSALCTMTVAMTGTLIFIITGWNQTDLPPWSTGYVYWLAVLCVAIPSSLIAPVGASLSYILPTRLLQYCFIVLLIITAVNLV